MNHSKAGCILFLILMPICVQMTRVNTDEYTGQTMETNVSGKAKRNRMSYGVKNMSCNPTKPLPCVCYKDGDLLVVDCSRQNLTSVPPNIPTAVSVLNLSYNALSNIPQRAFCKMAELKTLDLTQNRLTRLISGTFLGLRELKILNLNENLFNMSSGSFADDVFAPLSNLTYLNLKSRSQVENLTFQYPDAALSNLPSLATLLINGLSNRTFGRGVRKLTSLRTLDMSLTPSFMSLAKDTFRNFRNIMIHKLDLSHCNLTSIHKEAFLYLSHIDTIDYSYNQHLEIKGFALSTYGLQNSTIRKLVLQRVHAKPSFTVFTRHDCQYLFNTKLEELHMDNNSIGSVEEGTIGALPLSLKVIRISWNNIQTYDSQVVKLLLLPNMEEFDGSYQEVYARALPKAATSNSGLNGLASNTFGALGDGFDFFSAISYEKDSNLNYFTLYLPPNLWMVNCSHTYKLRFTIPALEFINSSLKIVNSAHNLLNKWTGPIKGIESLLYLDLTGNECKEVSETFFAYMTNLETLLIGKNRLGITNGLGANTFYNLTSLKHLNMNENQLQTVPESLFSRLTNLTDLEIAHNYLSTWNANISALIKLEKLNLANNSLRFLPASLCKDLDGIRKLTAIQVDIGDNRLECVCETEYFVEWLTVTKVKFSNLSTTFCTLANGTVVPLSANGLILKHLQRHCRKFKLLIGMSSACIVLFLIIVFVGIFLRHRWKLAYLFYMALHWRKRTGYKTLDSTEENPFGYDAFVSYEESDCTYIREQVIPRLETEAGLKLCIDKRDFIPGLYITDNILHAIQSSRKTVVFLTREFLKSKWCMFELNMARMEGIHTGRDILVLILPGNLPVGEMSAEIVSIIQTQTYIEMTNGIYGETVFWERLESAIRPT